MMSLTFDQKFIAKKQKQFFAFLNNARVQKVIVISSVAFVVAASSYSAIQGSRVLDFTSDSFVSTFMAKDWRPGGTVNLVSQHTNIMKYPLLFLQGTLHYNYFNYLFVNILLMCATMFGWSLLTWWLFKKSWRLFTATNFMLGGLLMSSTGLVISLVSTTTRNIEYPIALIYLILTGIYLKTYDVKKWLYAAVILAMLVASDYIFMYSLAPGLCLLAFWLWTTGKIKLKQAGSLISNSVVGVLAGLTFLKLLVALHVLTLTGRHAGSFISTSALPGDSYNSLAQTYQLFGGNFLGTPIKASYLGVLLVFVFTTACFVATVRTFREYRAQTKQITFDQFIAFALIAWALVLYAFYILLGQAAVSSGDNSRYLSALPFIGVFMLAVQSRNWRNKYSLVLLTLLVVMGGLMNSFHNYFSYQSSIESTHKQVAVNKKIINYAKQHDIQLILGSYDYGPALRFYSQESLESHAILTCNNSFYFFSYENWYKPETKVKKTAVVIDKYYAQSGHVNVYNSSNSCTDSALVTSYGDYADKVQIGKHEGLPIYLYIFNGDLRAKLAHATVLYL